MAHVMLATYPELFDGGAMIGSLPYGVAGSVDQAFQRMQGRNAPTLNTCGPHLLNAAPGAAARRRFPFGMERMTRSSGQSTHADHRSMERRP